MNGRLERISVPETGRRRGTVLAIHGRGSSPEDMRGLTRALDLPGIRFEIPRAPLPMGPGSTWYQRPYTDLSEANRAEFAESRRLLRLLLAEIAESGPAAVLGFSQGGVLALDLALRSGITLAAAVVMSGGLHDPESLPLELTSGPVGIPILWMHGTGDGLLPIGPAREQAQVVRDLGANLTFREFPIDHTISREELEAASRFLMEAFDM